MIGSKKILGFIPARGGSKGLPRKNIKLLSGKPLIAWTIEEARKSAIFDRILVSTDDEEIAEVARAYGADVPFIRPKELATDEAKGIDVFFHAVQWLRDHGETYDLFMLATHLRCGSPMISWAPWRSYRKNRPKRWFPFVSVITRPFG